MFKLFPALLLAAMTTVILPGTASAQVDSDLPMTVSAGCFSVCLQNINVKGVEGDVKVTNLNPNTSTVAGSIKVQCNGTDVPGATQSLGPVSVAGLANNTFTYSIAFTPLVGCAYTVVATATSSVLNPPTRSSTVTTAFAADCVDEPCGVTGCTLTQGYWKTHPQNWPVSSLTLGTRSYTQAELLKILNQPVKGNGLVSLAHQLIAAKLNAANGASCGKLNGYISSADAAIGSRVVPPVGGDSLSTSSVGNLVTNLDQFNQGLIQGCPGHCADTSTD